MEQQKKLYWSKLFQMPEDVAYIEDTLKTMSYKRAAAYFGEIFYGYECDEDFSIGQPYCANNGTDQIISQANGYTLLYNSTLGGVYLLYREAFPEDIEWWNDCGPGSLDPDFYIFE